MRFVLCPWVSTGEKLPDARLVAAPRARGVLAARAALRGALTAPMSNPSKITSRHVGAALLALTAAALGCRVPDQKVPRARPEPLDHDDGGAGAPMDESNDVEVLFDVAQAPRHVRPAVAANRSTPADRPSTPAATSPEIMDAPAASVTAASNCPEFPAEMTVGSSLGDHFGAYSRAMSSACAARAPWACDGDPGSFRAPRCGGAR